MTTHISVIIPTHNPNKERLERTLEALRKQELALDSWELLVIDNATPDQQYVTSFDIDWHPNAQVVREDRVGLTRARIAGIQASKGNYLTFVDDDNVLCPGYLKSVLRIFQQYNKVGVIGGKSIPEFEIEPEPWISDFWGCLALRDFGENIQIYNHKDNAVRWHPDFAPIGAGMSLRKETAQHYQNIIETDVNRLSFDRTGKSLQSGGDCDINLTLLDAGWSVGYFPELSLTHLIAADRLKRTYLARLNYASSRSWVQVLDAHGICPWRKVPKWTVLPRKLKAFFTYQPWSSAEAYIRWKGACGQFEGLATL